VNKNEATEIVEIMTLHNAAEYLNCHPSTVHRLVTRGGLPGFRLGRQWRFRREDIERWIEKHETIAAGMEPRTTRSRKGK